MAYTEYKAPELDKRQPFSFNLETVFMPDGEIKIKSSTDWKSTLPLKMFWVGCALLLISLFIFYLASFIELSGSMMEFLLNVYLFGILLTPYCFLSGLVKSFKATGETRTFGLMLNTSGLLIFCLAVYWAKSNL